MRGGEQNFDYEEIKALIGINNNQKKKIRNYSFLCSR